MSRIDHVLVAATDLERGAAQLRRAHGLVAQAGGRHPAFGTANLILPMGGQYLELVAVEDRDIAAGNPFGRAVLSEAREGELRPLAVCLGVDDLVAVSSRLDLPVEPGLRVTEDGSHLSWRSVAMAQAFSARRLPFFINWDEPDRHPGKGGETTDRRPTGFLTVEIGGDPAALRDWLGEDVPALVLVGGGPGLGAVTVSLADGDVVTIR
ncbi:MAG: VOC family protein [Candidatus Dormibacteria bacterium]